MNNIVFVGEHGRAYNVQWHVHDHWELVYCTSGQGFFRFESGVTIYYQAGEAVAIPPGEVHANNSAAGFSNIYLNIDEPAFPYRGSFRVTDDGARHLESAFAQARYYYLSDIKNRELVLTALGGLISSYMIVLRSNSEFSGPVEQIRSAIINGYTTPGFALDECIRAMPFSYDYLRKLFKKEMGMTPLEYMTGLRMKKAGDLLSSPHSGEYSMTEIAGQCGFDDALYFSRVFKKHFGRSPSAYAREQLG